MYDKPNLFIVGAPKCGTTSLANYLNKHPDIFIPSIKEPNFFSTDTYGDKHCASLRDYLDLYQSNERIHGDASTWYLFSKEAAKNISAFNAEAKIIIMLRNPVDLLHSLHSFLVYIGNEDIYSFEEALKAEPARKLGRRIPKSCKRPEALLYSEVVKFSIQIKRYFKFFDKKQIRILIFENFIKNTSKDYRDSLNFLEVDSHFVPEFRIYNQNKIIRNYRIHRFLADPPPFIKFMYSPVHKIVRGKWNKSLRDLNTIFAARRPMPENLRENLRSKFESEIEELRELINEDLSSWNR